MKPLRVLLGDDHPLLLTGIKALLERHYDVVGAVSDGRQLVDAALRLKPDLIVLDVSMPQLNGFEAAKLIRRFSPEVKLIFLSMHTNPMYLRKALSAGAGAYVVKTGLAEEILEAIAQLLAGNVYVSPVFGHNVLNGFLSRSGKLSRENEGLTDRQREVLQLIAEGRLSKEIAHIVGISVKTVDFHRGRIMEKLGVHSIAELVRVAVEEGLIPSSTSGTL